MIVELLVATDLAIDRGDLDNNSHDLHTLIGRDTQTLLEVLAALPKSPSVATAMFAGRYPS
jgi:hypothetical protein